MISFPISGSLNSKDYVVHAAYVVNALLAALAWLYFVSHGFTANGIVDGIYEIQSSALAQGRLSIVPGPQDMFYHDVLMWWGQYYFYWGLLPSAALLGLTKLMGRLAAHYVLTFGFLLLLVYFYQRIVTRIIETSSSCEDNGLYPLPIGPILLTWLLVFIIPYPHEEGFFFGRFIVYEQQILFGLSLAFPGLYFFITGVERHSAGRVALAAVFLSLASWTRVTWFPLAVVVCGLAGIIVLKWGREKYRYSLIRPEVIPLFVSCALVAGLLLLNYVRFHSPFDFGVAYQNPASEYYFRSARLFFSLGTKVWNMFFNIFSYYVPPPVTKQLGLYSRAFSRYESFPPMFFFINPQFLLFAALVPIGLYKALRAQNAIALWLGGMTVVALYLNIVIGFFGTVVNLRYFVEFYYFLIAAILAAMLCFVRARYALPLLVFMLTLQVSSAVRDPLGWWPTFRTEPLGPGSCYWLIPVAVAGILSLIYRKYTLTLFIVMLSLHLPVGMSDFGDCSPELRTVDAGDHFRVTSTNTRTAFLFRSPAWPTGSFSAKDLPRAPHFAAIGITAQGAGILAAKDIFEVYLVPGQLEAKSTQGKLEIRGLRSLSEEGQVLLFLENRLLCSQSIGKRQEIDLRVPLPCNLSSSSPYRVTVVFLRDGRSHLPGRGPSEPVLFFRQVLLKIPTDPVADIVGSTTLSR